MKKKNNPFGEQVNIPVFAPAGIGTIDPWEAYNKGVAGGMLSAPELVSIKNLMGSDASFKKMVKKCDHVGVQIAQMDDMPEEVQSIKPSSLDVYSRFTNVRKTKGKVVSTEANVWSGDIKTYKPTYEEWSTSAMTPSDKEDFDELRGALRVSWLQEPTLVFAIVVNKEKDDENQPSLVRCFGGLPFGGYVHDLARDGYLVRCVEFLQMGHVPFSFQVSMDRIGDWKVKVPVPEKILEKHFTPQQRKTLESYRDKYKTPRYEIHFIQMLGCHM